MFDLADSTVWWVLAGIAVASELFVGMFYLLMIAIGLAAGALAAHLGISTVGQIFIAAIVGSGFVVGCYFIRRRMARTHKPSSSDLNLDIGEQITIDAWRPDGTAVVRYRGTQWTAIAAPGVAHTPGLHRVHSLQGNYLVVDKAEPA